MIPGLAYTGLYQAPGAETKVCHNTEQLISAGINIMQFHGENWKFLRKGGEGVHKPICSKGLYRHKLEIPRGVGCRYFL